MCAPAKFTCFGAGRQKMVFPGERGALSALTRHFPTAVGKLLGGADAIYGVPAGNLTSPAGNECYGHHITGAKTLSSQPARR